MNLFIITESIKFIQHIKKDLTLISVIMADNFVFLYPISKSSNDIPLIPFLKKLKTSKLTR